MNAISCISVEAPGSQHYVTKITAQLEKTIKGFIEIGRLLADAHAALGRKCWLAMVSNDLPFTRRTAEKLMKVAADDRLTDARYIAKLPPHWTSLHELTLLDDEQLEYGFSENIISPDAERKHITALKEWRPAAHQNSRRDAAKPRVARTTASVKGPQVTEQHAGLKPPTRAARSGFTATLALPPQTPMKDARRFFEEISALCERHSATLEIAAKCNSVFQIHEEARMYMRSAREEFRRGNKGNDLAAIKDAFYQLGTGKKLSPNADGSLNSRDIASAAHTYGELDFDELHNYCQSLQISTQYTTLQDLDDCAYASQLLLIHLDGNPKERASALKILSELAKTSPQAERFVQVLNEQ